MLLKQDYFRHRNLNLRQRKYSRSSSNFEGSLVYTNKSFLVSINAVCKLMWAQRRLEKFCLWSIFHFAKREREECDWEESQSWFNQKVFFSLKKYYFKTVHLNRARRFANLERFEICCPFFAHSLRIIDQFFLLDDITNTLLNT